MPTTLKAHYEDIKNHQIAREYLTDAVLLVAFNERNFHDRYYPRVKELFFSSSEDWTKQRHITLLKMELEDQMEPSHDAIAMFAGNHLPAIEEAVRMGLCLIDYRYMAEAVYDRYSEGLTDPDNNEE